MPSIAMDPEVGVSSPAIVRSNVVLPAPVGPRTTRSSSLPTSRSTPASAGALPKVFLTPRTVRNESDMLVTPVFPRALIEDVERRGVEREAQRVADRVARLRTHDDAPHRRLHV